MVPIVSLLEVFKMDAKREWDVMFWIPGIDGISLLNVLQSIDEVDFQNLVWYVFKGKLLTNMPAIIPFLIEIHFA